MNVVVLSDFETQGGAAVATSRVCGAVAALGHRVDRVVCRPAAPIAGHDRAPWRTFPLHWRSCRSGLSRLGRKLCGAAGRAASDRRAVEGALDKLLGELQPDVIDIGNIHNALSGGWSDRMLLTASRHAPVCWTLYDMWSFTGRCAYAHGCRGFTTGCDARCPTASEYPSLRPELISPAWLGRRALLHRLPGLTAVTPSAWLAAEARRGLWENHRVEVINTGLSMERYRLLDTAAARAELGITASGPVLLAVAVDWSSPHKGAALLVEALRCLGRHAPTLLLLGVGELPGDLSGLNIVSLGFRAEDRFKSLAMAAADCLVHPATAENFSNVLLEAAACGLPAAVFGIGGNPEIVIDGQMGCVAQTVSGAGLAGAVERALALHGSAPALRERIRRDAERRFDVRLQAERYVALYQSLIRQGPGPGKEQGPGAKAEVRLGGSTDPLLDLAHGDAPGIAGTAEVAR